MLNLQILYKLCHTLSMFTYVKKSKINFCNKNIFKYNELKFFRFNDLSFLPKLTNNAKLYPFIPAAVGTSIIV